VTTLVPMPTGMAVAATPPCGIGSSTADHGGDTTSPAMDPKGPFADAMSPAATTAYGQASLPEAETDQSGFGALLNDSLARGRARLAGAQPGAFVAMSTTAAASTIATGVQPGPASGASVLVSDTRPGRTATMPIAPAIPPAESPSAEDAGAEDARAVRGGPRRHPTQGPAASAEASQPAAANDVTATNTAIVVTVPTPHRDASAAPADEVAIPTETARAPAPVAAPTSLVTEPPPAPGTRAPPTPADRPPADRPPAGRHLRRDPSASPDQPASPVPAEIGVAAGPPAAVATIPIPAVAVLAVGGATGAVRSSADHADSAAVAPISGRRPSSVKSPAEGISDAPGATPSQAVVGSPPRPPEQHDAALPDLLASSYIPPDGGAASPGPTVPPSSPPLLAAAASPAVPPTNQIASAVIALAPSGAQTTIVHLQPVELGHVQITLVRAADGPVSVALVAERPETLLLLLRDQAHLNQALDQAGVPAEARTISFDLAPSAALSPGNAPGEQPADHPAHRHPQPDTGSSGAMANDPAASGGAGAGDPQGQAGRSFGWSFATGTEAPSAARAAALSLAEAPRRMGLTGLDITA
jgi:flagellar hook-length control protein FliK